MWCDLFNHFSEICAILYGEQHYHGWNFKVPDTDSENLLGQFENQVSSIKLRDGCIFEAYKKVNNEIHIFTTNDDMEHLGIFDDEMSSFSCKCTTSEIYFIFYNLLRWYLF